MLITTVLATRPPTGCGAAARHAALAAAAVVLRPLLVLLGLVVFFLATSITGGVSRDRRQRGAGLQSIQDWLAGPPLNIGATQFDALLHQVTQRLQNSVTTIATAS